MRRTFAVVSGVLTIAALLALSLAAGAPWSFGG